MGWWSPRIVPGLCRAAARRAAHSPHRHNKTHTCCCRGGAALAAAHPAAERLCGGGGGGGCFMGLSVRKPSLIGPCRIDATATGALELGFRSFGHSAACCVPCCRATLTEPLLLQLVLAVAFEAAWASGATTSNSQRHHERPPSIRKDGGRWSHPKVRSID